MECESQSEARILSPDSGRKRTRKQLLLLLKLTIWNTSKIQLNKCTQKPADQYVSDSNLSNNHALFIITVLSRTTPKQFYNVSSGINIIIHLFT